MVFSEEKLYNVQAWILAQDIGQYQAKIQVMSDQSCFTTDTVVRREEHLVSIGISYSGFLFYEHFKRQFT